MVRPRPRWTVRFLTTRPVPRRVSDAVLVFLAFGFLYGITHDAMYFFDSVLYAAVIQNPLRQFSAPVLFEWNHPLWYPTTKLFFSALTAAGFPVSAYESNQWFNTLVGATGVSLLFLVLSRFLPRSRAVMWTGLAAFSQVYWSRATGGENYLTGTVLVVGAVAAAARYGATRAYGSLVAAGLLGIAAAWFHIANAICFVLLALAVGGEGIRRGRWRPVAVVFFLGVAGAAPYAWLHGLGTWSGFRQWFRWGSGLVNGVSPASAPTGQFHLEWPGTLGVAASTLWNSLLAPAPGAAGSLILSGVLALFLLMGIGCADGEKDFPTPEKPGKAFGGIVGVTAAAYVALLAVWQPGNMIYWATPVTLVILWVAWATARPLWANAPVSPVWFRGAAVALLAVQNLTAVVWGNAQGAEVQPLVYKARLLREITPPGSPVIISGLHQPLLKTYIPYFSRRNRIALQLEAISAYAGGGAADEAVERLIATHLRGGKPVYALGEVLGIGDGLAVWGLTGERWSRLWDHYLWVPVHRFPDAETLFLLWPASGAFPVEGPVTVSLERVGLSRQAARLRGAVQHPGAFARNAAPPSSSR